MLRIGDVSESFPNKSTYVVCAPGPSIYMTWVTTRSHWQPMTGSARRQRLHAIAAIAFMLSCHAFLCLGWFGCPHTSPIRIYHQLYCFQPGDSRHFWLSVTCLAELRPWPGQERPCQVRGSFDTQKFIFIEVFVLLRKHFHPGLCPMAKCDQALFRIIWLV